MTNKQKRAIWYAQRERKLKWYELVGLMDDYKAFKGNSKREKTALFEKMLRKKGGYLIKEVTPIYSGGGIYIYTGRVNNSYFIADDYGLNYTSCDVVNMLEYDDYMNYITGCMNDVNFRKFYPVMLKWIIEHQPQNENTNYSIEGIESHLKRHEMNELKRYGD